MGVMIFSKSMVVNNFNFKGIAVFELKAKPPLIIDAYTVEAHTVPLQLLQSIIWRNPEIVDPCGSMQHQELALCNISYAAKSKRWLSLKQLLRF
jgi:hypothetical protein